MGGKGGGGGQVSYIMPGKPLPAGGKATPIKKQNNTEGGGTGEGRGYEGENVDANTAMAMAAAIAAGLATFDPVTGYTTYSEVKDSLDYGVIGDALGTSKSSRARDDQTGVYGVDVNGVFGSLLDDSDPYGEYDGVFGDLGGGGSGGGGSFGGPDGNSQGSDGSAQGQGGSGGSYA